MSNDLVLVDASRPHITLITLNRPEKRNALSIPLLTQLAEALEEANSDPNTRVIIIQGAGKVFCAGLDLSEARDPQKAHESAELVARAVPAIAASPKVTIAAVRGAAIAGGGGVCLGCDLAVVSPEFKIGFVETRRGLVAGIVMTFLRRKLSEAKSRELLLLGEFLEAEEALALGLVNRLVDSDQVLDEALALADLALKSAPGAIALTKKLYDDLYDKPISEHFAMATALHKTMRVTDEAAEGLEAFQEGRLPNWDPEA